MPPEHHITLWGLAGSGKTTYLVALFSYHLNPNEQKQQRRFILPSGNTNNPFIDYLGHYCDEFQSTGKLPPSTSTDEPPINIHTQFSRSEKGIRNIHLYDISGGYMTDRDDSMGYLEHIKKSTGILMMFDSHPNPEQMKNYLVGLRLLINTLKDCTPQIRNKLKLAICLTKIDQENVWGNSTIHINAKRYLTDKLFRGNNAITGELFDLCPSHQCFAISSVGTYRPNNGEEVSNLDVTNNKLLKLGYDWQPINLYLPFDYLVD